MKAIRFLFTLLLVLVLLPSAWGWPAVYKEGVTVSELAKYFKGYTLFEKYSQSCYHEQQK
ncbi:MAG: hypothetical protein A3F41_00975 [Coxiella sp. RIFCSPHIGHO2_12_FULL_44_14]|nr:MAG: hypothetical protein A3F41_00975 [Coxiella sp. RIFCSPHIGHO2_12_FULL_44_14]